VQGSWVHTFTKMMQATQEYNRNDKTASIS